MITIDAVSEVGQVLVSMRGVFDGVEPVDELDHALQCAGHALAAGEDDGLVVACLLHDVARSPLLPQDGDHERVAAQWLAPRFGERVAVACGGARRREGAPRRHRPQLRVVRGEPALACVPAAAT